MAEAVRQSKRTLVRHVGWTVILTHLHPCFYVYLIRSINFPVQKYIGLTDNLKERLETHNSGGLFHTKSYRPWHLVMFFGFDNKLKAAAFEKYLKSGAGRAFAKKRFW